MLDTYGDGWNGNSLEIYACDGETKLAGNFTLDSGVSGTDAVCLTQDVDLIYVVVGGGSYPSEISWSVETPSGEVISGAGEEASTYDETCVTAASSRFPSPLPTPMPTAATVAEGVTTHAPTSSNCFADCEASVLNAYSTQNASAFCSLDYSCTYDCWSTADT